MKKISWNPLTLFGLTVLMIAFLAWFGPEEKSLGSNIRIVYLHGAWVLTAEAAFAVAGILGILYLVSLMIKREKTSLAAMSRAAGLIGIIYWVTYLPLSMFAMQANWNGLFLAEPRFALALAFAVAGILLQVGLWLIESPWLTSIANLVYILALKGFFSSAKNVMHPPPSPIFNSGNVPIITYFVSLMALTFLSAFFLWLAFFKPKSKSFLR